jgi:hypothetical protein
MTYEKKVLEGKIFQGPNKWDLILKALAEGNLVDVMVRFAWRESEVNLQLKIIGIISEFSHEDNTDWHICGELIKSRGWRVIANEMQVFSEDICFFAAYSTHDRKGEIYFKKMPEFMPKKAFMRIFQ